MTAMQELIEIIKQKRKESDISNTMLRFAQVEAEKLLETENQQLKEMYIKGIENYDIRFKRKENL